MFVVTLLTSPSKRNLDSALVDSLRNAWGGSEANWLSPDEAAEFVVPVAPENQWHVWGDVQKMGVDLVIQPATARRKQVLLADMDSTMIQQECVDELATSAGVGDQVAAITKRAMNGEIGFEGALRERVALLKDLNSGAIETVFRTRITFTPGGDTLVATMKAAGAYTALVSGGFTAFTKRVAARLGFDEHRANHLRLAGGFLTGEVSEPILGREAKVEALEEITRARGLTEADVLAVGDGANDLGMIERAGTGVALHAKPTVAARAEVRINHGDLTALLFIQGFARNEFVSP